MATQREIDKLQHFVNMTSHELTNLTTSISNSDDLIDDLLETHDAIDEVVLSPIEAEHRAYIEQLRASYGPERVEYTDNGVNVASGFGICYGDNYGITTLDDWTINMYIASGAYYSNGASGGCSPDAADIPAYILNPRDTHETMDTGAASGTLDWRIIHWSDRWDSVYWHLMMPLGQRGTYGVLDKIDKFTTGKDIQQYNYDKLDNIKDLYNIYLGNGGSWSSISIPSGADYNAAIGGSGDGLPVHNNIRGLQGDGISYYHLTESQFNDLTDGGSCTIHTHEGIGGGGQGSGNEYGNVHIENGTNLATVVFTESKSSSGYSITGNLSNLVEEPSIFPHIISSKSPSGFTVTFSDNMDGDEYYFLWTAVETVDTGIENIPNGQNYVDVVFDTQRSSNTYIVNYSIRNDTDSPVSIYPSILTVKTINGFRITLSDDVDSSNYYLEWNIGD